MGFERIDELLNDVIADGSLHGVAATVVGFDGGQPVLRPPKTRATVRQLMNHTAGCGYHFLNDKLYTYCTNHGFPDVLSGRKQSISAPLVHHPGTRSGSTASAPTGSARSSRPSAARPWASTSPSTSGVRSV